MRAELLETARQAVDLALAAGADDAVCELAQERSQDFHWRDDVLEKVQESASRSLSLSLYVDGRFSTNATSDPNPARLERFVGEAVELTRLLQPDPHRRIPDPSLYADRAEVDLELSDPALAAADRDSRIAAAKAIAETAGASDEVVSALGRVLAGSVVAARVSSNGFADSEEGTVEWRVARVTIREGADRRPEGARVAGARHRDDLRAPEWVGAEALRRALERRGARKAKSRRATLVVEPSAGGNLVGRLLGALSAGAVQQGRSFLAGRLGETVASAVLDLVDDPLVPRGMASRRYDGEGITARRLPLFEQGRLANLYVDTYYGSKLDLPPTTGSASNVCFRGGEGDLASLLASVDDGFLVRGWLGGNADPTSGEFSLGFYGHRIAAGALAEPVAEMNVSGNLLDLVSRLVAAGADPEPWSSLRTPTLVFDDVQFSGG